MCQELRNGREMNGTIEIPPSSLCCGAVCPATAWHCFFLCNGLSLFIPLFPLLLYLFHLVNDVLIVCSYMLIYIVVFMFFSKESRFFCDVTKKNLKLACSESHAIFFFLFAKGVRELSCFDTKL